MIAASNNNKMMSKPKPGTAGLGLLLFLFVLLPSPAVAALRGAEHNKYTYQNNHNDIITAAEIPDTIHIHNQHDPTTSTSQSRQLQQVSQACEALVSNPSFVGDGGCDPARFGYNTR
jgi:hypothetical protein